MSKKFCLVFIWIVLQSSTYGIVVDVYGQDSTFQDTISRPDIVDTIQWDVNDDIVSRDPQEYAKGPDPKKATMYAAVLPGLGQIYNRKYWKVPLVYGGFTALGYYMNFNNDQYVRFRRALDYRLDGNSDTVDEFADDPRYTNEVLTSFRDQYRRFRDRAVIYTALFYAVTIIDAAVDAHMYHFDVSDDLSLRLGPSLQGAALSTTASGRPGIGLGLRLSMNF